MKNLTVNVRCGDFEQVKEIIEILKRITEDVRIPEEIRIEYLNKAIMIDWSGDDEPRQIKA